MEEHIQEFSHKLSKALKGKSKPHQKGNLNRFHKDNLTGDLIEKIRSGREKTKKPVVTPLGRFASVTEAADSLGVDKATIGYRIKRHPLDYYYYEIKV
jgi:hypothetical protein